MHSAPSVDEGLRFRTRPTTSNANHRRTPLDWYPFPKVQNKIKSDQCRQYRQLIIYYFIVSLMCVGNPDVFLWIFLFSTFQGASRTKTCSLWVLQRDRWSCPGCIPCEGVMESNSAIQRISWDTPPHLQYVSRSGMCSKATKKWDLAHQVTKTAPSHHPVIEQKLRFAAAAPTFWNPLTSFHLAE